MVVVGDEGANLLLEIARQVTVLEQNAVLERLMPTLDLALRLRMQRGASDMFHALLLEPVSQVPMFCFSQLTLSNSWSPETANYRTR